MGLGPARSKLIQSAIALMEAGMTISVTRTEHTAAGTSDNLLGKGHCIVTDASSRPMEANRMVATETWVSVS